jgi:hypothetical protein
MNYEDVKERVLNIPVALIFCSCFSFLCHISAWNSHHTYTAGSFCVLGKARTNHVCCGSVTIGIQTFFLWENPQGNLLQLRKSSTSILYKMIQCHLKGVSKVAERWHHHMWWFSDICSSQTGMGWMPQA